MDRLRVITVKSALFLTVLLGTAEIGLRMVGYAQGPCQYYDSDIGYRYYPNQERTLLGTEGQDVSRIVTNTMGYRGPWYGLAGPAGTRRVVCLGDSFTFGWGVESEQAYPSLLEGQLLERVGADPVLVENMGVPGYNTRNELNAYRAHARGKQPDVVILGFYQNDLEPDSGGPRHMDSLPFRIFGTTALAEAFHLHLRNKIPMFRAGRSPELKEQIAYYSEHGQRVRRRPNQLASKPYWDECLGALEEVVQSIRADGSAFLLIIFPGAKDYAKARKALSCAGGDPACLTPKLFPLQAKLKAKAKELDVEVLDLLLPFCLAEGDPFESFDRGHPGTLGHVVTATAVRHRLEKLGYL